MDDELEKSYNELRQDDFLKKSIDKAIKDLRANAFSGIIIAKRLIPKAYIKKYKINNLWKYDLPRGWRLFYTVTADNEVELITAILEWLSHKEYERKFKY
jgi:Txe/YoeB family toxin of Txe-Axe toxin-antitoxin module